MNLTVAERRLFDVYTNYLKENVSYKKTKLKKIYTTVANFAIDSDIFTAQQVTEIEKRAVHILELKRKAELESGDIKLSKKGFQYVATAKKYKEQCSIAKGENNDCVVRAFASAFDVEYKVAHKTVADLFKRKNGKGVLGYKAIMDKATKILGKEVMAVQHPEHDCPKRIVNEGAGNIVVRNYTVSSFTQEHKKGCFIVQVDGHAFTIKDGIIYGNIQDGEKVMRIVQSAYLIY